MKTSRRSFLLGACVATLLPVEASAWRKGKGFIVGVIVQDGDSITANVASYANQYDDANPSLTAHNIAVGGSGMIQVNARQPTALAYYPQIISLFIGANGIEGTPSEYVDTICTYFAPFRARGAKAVVCTILPHGIAVSGYAAFNVARVEVNNLLKAEVGNRLDAVADFDATLMGLDATANDTTYFSDGLHPTVIGQGLLLPNYTGAMSAVQGITREVTQFTFTDINNATASAQYISNSFLVGGLNYAETKPITVSDGEYRKNGGSWTSLAGTVTNGDTVDVRGTASATLSGFTNVVLTIGNITDTYTIQTEAASSVVWSPNLSPPAPVDKAFSTNTHTFAGVSFDAGLGIVDVAMQTRNCSSVTVNGVAATKIVDSNPGSAGNTIWTVDVPVAGNYDVVVSAASSLAIVSIITGTLTGANITPNSSAIRSPGSSSDPHTTASILTVLSGGIGLMFSNRGASTASTWNVGTEEVDNLGGAIAWAHTSAINTLIETPSINLGGFANNDMACAAWGPL